MLPPLLRAASAAYVLWLLWVPSVLRAQEAAPRPAITTADIDALLESDWFGVYFQGKKIGYLHTTRIKAGQGDDAVYRETLLMTMKLTSFGQKAEITFRQVLDFDRQPPFALRRAEAEENDPRGKQIFKLTRTAK